MIGVNDKVTGAPNDSAILATTDNAFIPQVTLATLPLNRTIINPNEHGCLF